MLDALFSASVFALIIGRFFYVLGNPDLFAKNLFNAFILIAYPGVSELFFWVGFFVYWFIYSLKKKISFNNLINILYVPVVSARVLLALFSLIKSFSYFNLFLLVLFLLLAITLLLINKFGKSDKLRASAWPFLILYLSIPPFVVDFINKDRIYFEGLNILTRNQILYLVAGVLGLILLVFKLIKKQK